MAVGKTEPDGESPSEAYFRQLQELQRVQAMDQKRERLLGYIKAAIALFVIVTGLLYLRDRIVLESLLSPVVLFEVLAVLHDKVLHAINLRTRAIGFYNRGLARVEDHWAGSGESGDRFFDPLHPYARDLDIFGKASVFELLCTVPTRAGEATLAAWLLAPAHVKEILARQSRQGFSVIGNHRQVDTNSSPTMTPIPKQAI